jgi:predicted site-specific integrase-resolvase
MAIIRYARVSTTGQSLEQQLTALTECEKVFQEKISGSKTDRPQLQAMLEFARSGDAESNQAGSTCPEYPALAGNHRSASFKR